MAWRLDGTYFENCNCEVTCPCAASGFAAPADYDRCQFLMAFHVDKGKVDDVDVSGLTVAVVGDTPGVMVEGNWRVGLLMDAQASEQQATKLASVFSGQQGGPMGALAPLISEMLGIEKMPIEYSGEGRRHRVKIGEGVEIVVEDVTSPLDAKAPSPTLVGGGHPANSTLTVARATSSRISAFGLEMSNEGKSGLSAPFSWAG